METVNVTFRSNEYSNAPNELECVATLEDIQKIRDTVKEVRALKTCDNIDTLVLNITLYSYPNEVNWKSDVNHVSVHVIGPNASDDINVYQFYQSKWDAGDQIESDQISLNKLEKYLKGLE